MERIVSLCKQRGFIFGSADIYGGFRSTYDYGPLGVLMLRNVRDAWWRFMVQERPEVVGLDAAILSSPKIWEASGHLANFTDPLVDCRSCKERWRADHVDGVCPKCGSTDLTPARAFNLMFKTFAGPVEDEASVAYLRPETAQGMFVNFALVQRSLRLKPPFGIAQLGKSFRNEITPGNFVFRTREFEQMEMEFFVPPDDASMWFDYWVAERFRWYQEFGIPQDRLRLRPHDPDELSHYSAGTVDIEFEFPWGFGELEGIANRTDYDLNAHAKASGQDLSYFDPSTNQRYVPHVIEPAGGVTRAMMAFLIAAFDEDEIGGERRAVLRLHPRLAPYTVSVLPLSKKPELSPVARELFGELSEHFSCDYDDTQSIGRRYRRQDEIGTPWCVTVDFETLNDRAVTVRDRDSTEQVRISLAEVVGYIQARYTSVRPGSPPRR
ncbi:MAG: glycine--tRNA ligase [Ferrimicrobium sp.]